MNIKWDAKKYTDDFSYVHKYGNDVIELIQKKENAKVLDLGCGNGALTKVLSDKGFNAFGMDDSLDLLEKAKNSYKGISFIKGNAINFNLKEKVDVVFSNAVFHWIPEENQMDMLQCIYNALKKDGQFVFEFGGYGNNKLIHTRLEEEFIKYGYSYNMPFFFPTIGKYSSMLETAGFKVEYAVLFDRMTELKGEDGMKNWINMFVKEPFNQVRCEERDVIIDKVVEDLRPQLYRNNLWYADYVRLRMRAIKE